MNILVTGSNGQLGSEILLMLNVKCLVMNGKSR